MSQNYTLSWYLAKTGRDQHLIWNHQSHILFYKVLFDKEQSKPLMAKICGRNSLSLPQATPFSKFGTESCHPSANQKGWKGVEGTDTLVCL